VAATTAATSCRDPVASAAPRGGSLAATALSAARDALDERRPVGMDVPDLSSLAGARSGTVGAALRAQRYEIELQPLEIRTFGGATTYVKVEKPRFLFLEGSMGAVVAAVVATAALPDTSAARAGASVVRAVPSTDACSCTASAALGEGAQDPTSLGEPAPHHSLLPPLTTTSTPRLPKERVPAARAVGTPRPAVPGAPAAGSSAPSCASPTLAPNAAPRARSGRGRVRPRGVHD
jgi:hypothetical protein